MRFELIQGGLAPCVRWRGTELYAGRQPMVAFRVRIVEEDSFLVLSAPPLMLGVPDHPVRFWTGILDERARPLGSAVKRGGSILAVIHALERDPTVSLDGVRRGWINALRLVHSAGYSRVSAQLLGTHHARLPLDVALGCLLDGVDGCKVHLDAIWLECRQNPSEVRETLVNLCACRRAGAGID